VKEFTDGSYIIFVGSDESNSFRRDKIQQIREMVDSSLNYSCDENWKPANQKTYLYIQKKKVIGCAIAEIIESAFKIYLPQSTENVEVQSDKCIISKEPHPANIGISRIWVHQQYRRQGIATALLDTVRNTFIYSVSVKKDRMAVTQPSSEGRLFATHYFGTGEFLIFTPHL